MSRLTKCDICGDVYNEDTIPATVSTFNVVEYAWNTGSRYYNDHDCCPKCTEKLKEFVKSLKVSSTILNKGSL